MAKRFYSTFYSIGGTEFGVEIWDSSFASTATELTLGADGFRLRYTGQTEERINPILGSELSFDIMVEDATIEALITDLAASAEGRFTVRVTQGPSGAAQYWVGRIMPDISIYEDRNYPYVFTVSATDGIGALKDIPYRNTSAAYFGDARLTEHLINALNKLSHISEFYGASDEFLVTAVDWWENSMTNSASTDPLYQAWANHATFYNFDNDGEKEYLSCYEVLEAICKIFHARLVHMHGAYWVEQIPVKTASSWYARSYDNTGAYLGNTTVSGVNTINGTENGTRIATVQYDFYPALLRVRLDQQTNNRQNYLAGESIDQDYTGKTIYSSIDQNGGLTTLRLTGQLQISITNDTYAGNVQDNLMLVFEIKIKVGTKYVLRQYEIQNFSVNYDPAEWNTSVGSVVSYLVPIWPTPSTGNTTVYSIPITFTTPPLTASAGVGESEFDVNLVNIKLYDGTGAFLGDFTTEWSLQNPWLEVMSYGNPTASEDYRTFYCEGGSTDNTAVLKLETILGDSPNPNTIGRLKVGATSTSLTDTSLWGAGASTPDKELLSLLVKTIADGQWTPIRRLNGILAGDVYWYKKWQINSDTFCFLNGTFTASREEIDGQWFLLDYGADGTPTSPIKKKKYTPKIPSEVVYDNPGSNAGAGTGALVELIGKPPSTVLSPIKHASIAQVESAGAKTSLTINETLDAGDFAVNDEIVLVNPMNGFFETLTVTATSTAGATSIAVSGTLTADYPTDSYIMKKPLIGSGKMPGGTAAGQILRWNNTSKRWVVYSGTTNGHVLTWDSTNGWQSTALPSTSYTFTNGITETSGTVRLGGALTQNTLISGAYNLNFTNTRITIGSTSTSFTASTVIAKNGTGTTLSSVALHLAGNGGDNNAKLSLGVGDSYGAGLGYFFTGAIFRMYHMNSAYTIRWAIGSETSDKMILTADGNGRLGVGFSSTTGLHSTLQSSGSIAGACLNTLGAPTFDATKFAVVYTNSTNQTYTLPAASGVTGRIFWIMHHGSAGTITLSANVKTASGSSFNTLAAGEMALFTSDGLDYRGKKW